MFLVLYLKSFRVPMWFIFLHYYFRISSFISVPVFVPVLIRVPCSIFHFPCTWYIPSLGITNVCILKVLAVLPLFMPLYTASLSYQAHQYSRYLSQI